MGVTIRPLTIHPDGRGHLMEVHRQAWHEGPGHVQWNVTHSESGVLRGVHAHVGHEDVLVLLSGAAIYGVQDLRRAASTFAAAAAIHVASDAPCAVSVPRGVAHGFYFLQPSVMLYGLTNYWSREDEFGCRWDAAGLRIPWSVTAPVLSARDGAAGSLQALMDLLEPHQAALSPGRAVDGRPAVPSFPS